MSDLKIYHNGENKVLMSAGNKIIKQPYEYGSAHKICAPVSSYFANMYIRAKSPIDNINNGAFSIMMHVSSADISNSRGILRFESSSYICSLGLGSRAIDSGIGVDFNKNTEATYGAGTSSVIGGYNVNAKAVSVVLKKGVCTFMMNQYINTADLSAINFNSEIYNYLTICRGQLGAYSYESPRSSVIMNRVVVFNREISTGEHLVFYNNALGSELQSTQGIVLDIRCSYKSEILDFSTNNYNYSDYDPLNLPVGSDFRVACRDYSGYNRHGEIMNLPAGTLQEKMDYANANLFVPFIS